MGDADMFSMEGFACQNNIVLDRVMWGLALLAWFRLWMQALWMLRERIVTGRRSGVKTIFVQCAYVLPFMVGTLALRVATGWNLGADLTMSILFSMALIQITVSAWLILHSLFAALLQGTTKLGQNEATKALIRRAYVFGVFMNFFFACCIIGSQVGGCFLPLGPSPGRIGLLILRNMGIILYFGSFIIMDVIQMRSLSQLKQSLKDRVEVALPAGSSDDVFARTMAKFHDNINAQVKRVILLFVMNIIFCAIPPLFVWNFIGITVVLALTAGPNYALHNLRSVTSTEAKQTASTLSFNGTDNQGHASLTVSSQMRSSVNRVVAAGAASAT